MKQERNLRRKKKLSTKVKAKKNYKNVYLSKKIVKFKCKSLFHV